MKSTSDILKELKELNSSLPPAHTPYAVPEAYFEGFAASVLQKIKGAGAPVRDELEALSPLLAGISKKMPYAVPENYFQQTQANIPALTSDDPLPALLLQAGKAMPYQVPEGYFNRLAEN